MAQPFDVVVLLFIANSLVDRLIDFEKCEQEANENEIFAVSKQIEAHPV